MKDKLQRQIERLTRAHKRHSRWQRLVAVLAGVVALCTLGVLMMPAVAMEGEPHCGKAEHTHTDACYTQVLTCGQEEGNSHTHTEACYTRELTCGLAEHTHTDACYRDAAESAATPEPETTAEPTETPAATKEPEATAEPTATPEPTVTPTATPEPTVTPVPSITPNQTEGQEDDGEDNADNATVFAAERAADGVIASGNCGYDYYGNGGKNLTWTLTSDGTLTISGTGEMGNFGSDYWSGGEPWAKYCDEIKKIIVEEGVTSLGRNAFSSYLNNATEIQLPDSLTSIGTRALSGYKWDTFTIPKNVRTIGSLYNQYRVINELIIPYDTQLDTSMCQPQIYTRKLVWNTDKSLNVLKVLYSGYSDASLKEVSIGPNVTKICTSQIYGFLNCLANAKSENLLWGGQRWINIEQDKIYAQESPSYSCLDNLTSGAYYIDGRVGQGAFYRIENGKATLALLLAANQTEYTIPASIPASDEEGAEQIPVTAIMGNAFAKTVSLQSLTIEAPDKIVSLPDYAFTGASQLEKINEKTQAKEIMALFTNKDFQHGGMPFLGTKIIGDSNIDSTLKGYTITSTDGTLQVKVKTAEGSKYPQKTKDNAYFYYTGEEAVTSITITNPGEHTQDTDTDTGDVVRVYVNMNGTGVTANYAAGNTYDFVAKAGDNSTGKTYKLTVTKIDDVTCCYEFERPLNGETYSIDLKQRTYSGYVGNRDCIIRAVIAQKSTDINPIPPLTDQQYEKLCWRAQPVEQKMTGGTISTNLENRNGVAVASISTQFVTISGVGTPPPSGFGEEKISSVKLTYTINLPDNINLPSEAAEALAKGVNNVNGSTIISASISDRDATPPSLESARYDAANREITVTVNSYYSYIGGRIYLATIGFTLQAANPEENTQYKLPYRVTGTAYFKFGDVQTLEGVTGNIVIQTGTAAIRPYVVINQTNSYNTPNLYWGQTYPVTVGVNNATLYDFKDKFRYVRYYLPGDNYSDGQYSSYTYLSAADLESIFGTGEPKSGFWPEVTITGAELCQEPEPQQKQVTLADGTNGAEVTRQYSSVYTDTKYATPYSSGHAPAKTTNAQITIKLTSDRQHVEMAYQYYNGGIISSGPVTCDPTAAAMQKVLDDWGYVVTGSTKTEVVWSFSPDRAITFTVPGNTNYKIADFTVTVKDAFMFKNSDWGNSVTCRDSYYSGKLMAYVKGSDEYYYAYALGAGYGYGNASISTSYQINGREPEENQQPTHEDVLQHTDTFTIYRGTKVNGIVPLVDVTSGAQVLLAEADKNKDRPWTKDLKTVTYNNKNYYQLDKAGTYKGVWLSGDGVNAGTYTYADEITVTGEAGAWTNMIRLYTTADQTENTDNDLAQNFYYLTKVYSNMVPQYSINGIVWAGDHETHRLTTYYNGRVMNFDLTKEIVPEAPTEATGKKASAVSSGETVIYRITLRARDGLTGQITLQGKDMQDLLPASLTGFRWKKDENITVSYNSGTGEGAGTINGDLNNWEITVPDAKKPNQQAVTWGDDFSISFGSQPVYVYVQLTYPQGEDWDAYVDAYSSTGVVNTFRAMGMDDSVSHSLKVTGKGVLQKGIYNTAIMKLTSYYSRAEGQFISDKGTNSRNIYGTTGTYPFVTQYYITIANEGKGRLYLEDVQDILPDGMTLKNLQSTPVEEGRTLKLDSAVRTITTANSFPFAVCTTSGKNFTAVKAQVAASTADLQDGRQKVTFTFTPGESGTVKYDAESSKCYLESGQAIQFGYFCYSGSKAQSKDSAVNTAVMPYCDYNDGGIEVGTSRFAVKGSSQMEAVLPNDDKNPTINENAWAADCGFAVDSADETTKWLTSTVTQHLGNVEIGLSKTLYGSTKSPNTKPNAVDNEEEVYWSVLVENKGTTALEDYVISDEIQEPYRITSVCAYFGTTEQELKNGYSYAYLCSIGDYDEVKDTFILRCGYQVEPITVDGKPVKMTATTHAENGDHPVVKKDPSFYIAIVRDKVSGKLRVNIRLAGPTWAVQGGTYTDFRFTTKKPENSPRVNTTYTNTAWLTPLRDDLGWDGTATKGVIDENLSAPYWDKTRTSIRSSANVMVSYGYSTSSSIAVSQKDPADNTVYSTSSDEADTTTVLPDKNDKVHYTLTVDNTVYVTSPQALTKLVLINNLPQKGDHNPFQDDDMRGSEYQMSLTGDNTFTVKASIRQKDGTFETKEIDPQYITIQYSKDVSFDGDDWNGKDSVKWTSDPEGARSFRIVITDPTGAAMPAHSKVTVEYDAKADNPDSIDPGQTAYNSFGYHYEVTSGAALEAAPSGVGLRTPYVPTLQKRLETPDGEAMAAGADAKFNFVIYDGAAVTLKDGFTESDLAAALSGHTYTYVEKAVAQGQMESDAPWLNNLKQYSYTGGTWTASDADWTWKNGTTYNVIELPVTGDYRYGSINRSAARSYSFTYNYTNKNTLQCVNIGTSWAAKLTKTEENKPAVKLQDAYFALYSPVEADQMADAIYDALTVTKKPAKKIVQDSKTWYLKSVDKTGDNGTLTWAGLSASEYLYVEVQAPNGYNLDSTVHKVTRPTGGGTASDTVTNRPGYNLPETGGIGTWPFMAAGLLLTGTALALLLKKRKTNN